MRRLRVIAIMLLALSLLSGCTGLFGPKKYVVSGTIVDGSGQGVEGVDVWFGKFGTTRTGANGSWQSPQLSGDVYVTPVKEGWTFEPEKVLVSKQRTNIAFVATEIPVGDPYTISGSVVDGEGVGLSGVTITFSGGYEAVTTDEHGNWVRDGLLGIVKVTPTLHGWQFDPASYTVTDEETGIEFTAQLHPIWTKPVLEFTGDSQYVRVPNDSSLQLTGPLTIEILLMSEDNGTYSTVLSKGSAEYEIVADWRPGHAASLNWRSFGSGSGDIFPGFFEGYSGKWVHVALVHDNGTLHAYRDGQLFGTVLMPELKTGTSELNLGRRPWSSQKFTGQMSYVRIWNVARTAEEISANLYTIDPSGTGLVANYRLDEGAGEVVEDTAGNNDGTIVGASWGAVDPDQI